MTYYFQIIFNLYSYCTNSIRYTLTTIYYPSCQQISVVISHECKVIHKEFIYSNQIGSFLTILDNISRLSSIYIRIAPNSIRYTLTTINYPSCQQISVCYNPTSAMLFTKNLYTAIKLVHLWPFWTLFPDYLQFIFILHQIQFDTH